MKRISILALLLAAACETPDDGTFYTNFGIQVNPVGPTLFEVQSSRSGRTDDYWCGAAEYARRALGAKWSDPVYVARGLGTSVTTGRTSAVQFTIDPAAEGITPTASNALSGFRPGDSLSVQRAHTYCEIYRPLL